MLLGVSGGVVGAPGSGKTTFLNYLALTYARDLLDEGLGLGAKRLGAVPPQDLWHRVDQFLAETCPGAKVQKRWSGLVPMARSTNKWVGKPLPSMWQSFLLGSPAGGYLRPS